MGKPRDPKPKNIKNVQPPKPAPPIRPVDGMTRDELIAEVLWSRERIHKLEMADAIDDLVRDDD